MEEKGTRDLFLEILTKIGCQYELPQEEGDDRIFFAFQGEQFMANAKNELRFIQIWDFQWARVELYDIDEMARLKKVINAANLNNSVMTVYTINEATKYVDVHCKSTVLFIPSIPEIQDYLKLELSEFFRVHHFINMEMAKLREQEQKNNN